MCVCVCVCRVGRVGRVGWVGRVGEGGELSVRDKRFVLAFSELNYM